MTRLLLLSTYELGEQPLGLAAPATALSAAGHEVRTCDLSVEPWPADALLWAEAIGCSVPMHTAFRLALHATSRIRSERGNVPLAFYGLYANVAHELDLVGPGDLAVSDDIAAELAHWAGTIGDRPASFGVEVPSARRMLPGLDQYARFISDEGERLVGAVESTEGCNHRCRHCPVPLVYHGRSRPIALPAILDDIDELVDLGAGHIHFADPDFLNRPPHALRVARALHERHPGLSFDVTAKVSHLIRHRALVPELAASGLRFVISAFESTSDVVLAKLDKGHCGADLAEAVAIVRGCGVEPRPSFLPFTPWTTRRDVIELLDFVAATDLVANVDAVQFGIRLLLPPGSLLLETPDADLEAAVTGFDGEALGYAWRASDPVLDGLQLVLAALAEDGAVRGSSDEETYAAVRAATFATFGRSDPGRPAVVGPSGPPTAVRPRLSESWFCCAEPTSSQLERLAVAQREPEWVPVPLGVRTGTH